jgi:hypothetical protein
VAGALRRRDRPGHPASISLSGLCAPRRQRRCLADGVPRLRPRREPCCACKTPIKRIIIIIGGRGTHYRPNVPEIVPGAQEHIAQASEHRGRPAVGIVVGFSGVDFACARLVESGVRQQGPARWRVSDRACRAYATQAQLSSLVSGVTSAPGASALIESSSQPGGTIGASFSYCRGGCDRPRDEAIAGHEEPARNAAKRMHGPSDRAPRFSNCRRGGVWR